MRAMIEEGQGVLDLKDLWEQVSICVPMFTLRAVFDSLFMRRRVNPLVVVSVGEQRQGQRKDEYRNK